MMAATVSPMPARLRPPRSTQLHDEHDEGHDGQHERTERDARQEQREQEQGRRDDLDDREHGGAAAASTLHAVDQGDDAAERGR